MDFNGVYITTWFKGEKNARIASLVSLCGCHPKTSWKIFQVNNLPSHHCLWHVTHLRKAKNKSKLGWWRGPPLHLCAV